MPTAAFTITSAWQKAADGPLNVLIPAHDDFQWAITAGAAPSLSLSVCPRVQGGDTLSLTLASGESLYVAAHQGFETSVTTGS